MISRRWMVYEVNRSDQLALASMLSIAPITAAVLLARGASSAEQARDWLSTGRCDHPDPFLLPDMERAVERLHRAVRRGERICFYGDYDVDGMAATSLYLRFFRRLGADVCWYIPHRMQEGYGLNKEVVRKLCGNGVSLLVTSDCGTTAVAEVDLATSLGTDVIITDHHRCDGTLPAALVLNPHRADSAYPFSSLCSTGVAYKVVKAYATKYGAGHDQPESMLDLVALATIADAVPLQGENRWLVRNGLDLITSGSRCGIQALKQVGGVDGICSAGMVAFKLAPRINAAGRLASAEIGVRLLTTDAEDEAMGLAGRLDELNRDRQRIEAEITADALTALGATAGRAALVLSGRWHVGVVGIVAARLSERYHRPAVVIAVNADGIGRGSARSVPGFDLHQALCDCREWLEGFGGHPSAAGFTIREDQIPQFAERFTEVASRWSEGQPDPTLALDAEVRLRDLQLRLIRELEQLHPFGVGNPEPTFAVRDVTVLDERMVGEDHLKLTVRQGNSVPFECMGYRMDPGSLRNGRGPVDLAVSPELRRWNGLDQIQLRLRDLRTRAS